jgi:hypothetical protein
MYNCKGTCNGKLRCCAVITEGSGSLENQGTVSSGFLRKSQNQRTTSSGYFQKHHRTGIFHERTGQLERLLFEISKFSRIKVLYQNQCFVFFTPLAKWERIMTDNRRAYVADSMRRTTLACYHTGANLADRTNREVPKKLEVSKWNPWPVLSLDLGDFGPKGRIATLFFKMRLLNFGLCFQVSQNLELHAHPKD